MLIMMTCITSSMKRTSTGCPRSSVILSITKVLRIVAQRGQPDVESLVGGKVISILEGGYSLSAPATSAGATKASRSHGAKTRRAFSNDSDEDKLKMIERFAQQPGDGGLVKAALAHVAALARVDSWIEF